jgi:hypothetical protein
MTLDKLAMHAFINTSLARCPNAVNKDTKYPKNRYQVQHKQKQDSSPKANHIVKETNNEESRPVLRFRRQKPHARVSEGQKAVYILTLLTEP